MNELKVLRNRGTKSDRWERAYVRKADHIMNNGYDREATKQLILCGVKMVVTRTRREEEDTKQLSLDFFQPLMTIMSTLTPIELVNLFPITKEYFGHKYDIKDYYYTMEELNNLDQDAKIGDKLFGLLWDYHNTDLREFCVAYMKALSEYRRSLGQLGIIEEFMETLGVHPYYQSPDKSSLYDPKTRETIPFKRQVDYLRLV